MSSSSSNNQPPRKNTTGDSKSSGFYTTTTGATTPSSSTNRVSNLMALSKKDASLIINSECCQNGPTPELDILMDYLFHPEERLDNPVSIEWVRWLIAGGRTPEEFASIGKCSACCCCVYCVIVEFLRSCATSSRSAPLNLVSLV